MKRILLGLTMMAALAVATSASANTIWTLNNVHFEKRDWQGILVYENFATGSFEVNSTLTGLVTWNVKVTGTNTGANHDSYKPGANEIGAWYSPSKIGFFNTGSPASDLVMYFAAPLTNAGGIVNLANPHAPNGWEETVTCNGTHSNCTLMVSGSASGQPVPEPASMLTLGTGLLGLSAAFRRRFRRQ